MKSTVLVCLLSIAVTLNASVLPTEYAANSYAPGDGFSYDCYTYQPTPVDMDDLDHHYYYIWGIDMSDAISEGDIVAAELVFRNIRNWNSGSNILYVHLMDSSSAGLTDYYDNQGGGDNFASYSDQVLVGEWVNNPAGTAVDLVFHFDTDLMLKVSEYASNDGFISFGIDPDCHYCNDGVTFAVDIDTDAFYEPEPATMALFGLAGAIMLGKRRKQS